MSSPETWTLDLHPSDSQILIQLHTCPSLDRIVTNRHKKKHLQEERHSKGPVVRLDTWSLHRAMWWTTCSTGRAKLAAFSHFVHIVSDMNPLTLLHSLQAFTRLFGRQHPSASSVQISTLTVFLPIWLLFISSLLNPKVNVKSL